MSTYSFAGLHSQLPHAEWAVLSKHLQPVSTNYHRDSGCMDDTREFVLDQVIGWATKTPKQGETNTYWIYGLPGIGKTALAHSICATLHDTNQLAGAFFCQRDTESLSDHRNILPTLVYKLAGTFPPFRNVVAKRLRDDPHLTLRAMDHSLLLELISKGFRAPTYTLVFVIDAFDQCGDAFSRPAILRALSKTAASVRWLKIIITSRRVEDIDRGFGSSHERYDLGADKEASSDIKLFAQKRFEMVGSTLYLGSPWPEPPLFEKVISRAAGSFLFIETIASDIEACQDPERLKKTLEDSDGTDVTSLYQRHPINPSLYLDRAVFHLNLASIPLISGNIQELLSKSS